MGTSVRPCLVEAGAEETGDLLDDGLGGDEVLVLLGQLLDQLLVLVELLQSLDAGAYTRSHFSSI
jgi:hypothetical protein